MRILMLSWRGPGHPQAGGAEVVTHQCLRRWAAQGHEVTWFSGAWPGAAAEEVVDGIRVLRRGSQMSVHVQAWRWLMRRRDRFDRIVDQVNTIPFFTPFYVPRAQRRLLNFQLAREFWWRETRGAQRLIAPVGYVTEPLYMRVYRTTRAVTISASSRADLLRLGIADVAVIDMALDTPAASTLEPKAGPLRLVMLGRLTPAKFVEEGIRAFLRVRAEVPDARLEVIGSGDDAYRARLQAQIDAAGARDAVVFHGRVSHERRTALLSAAHVHVFTSHREGWGLTVSEAASVGTPTVGYDAPGVRDSIGEPELLAPIGDVEGVARIVGRLHADTGFADAVTRRMWERARRMDYDRTAEQLLDAVA